MHMHPNEVRALGSASALHECMSTRSDQSNYPYLSELTIQSIVHCLCYLLIGKPLQSVAFDRLFRL